MKFIAIIAFFAPLVAAGDCTAPASSQANVGNVVTTSIKVPVGTLVLACAPGFKLEPSKAAPMATCPAGGAREYTIANAVHCVAAPNGTAAASAPVAILLAMATYILM
eukprot:GEMP01103486.1.p1 GENE.GEMP01103486.1~~GEMP01103486.1.p1  ORF type:complete len:108 (+),score=23.10 GEMP01103486.1:68-391(+)